MATRFQDMMDSDRMVVPVKQEGNKFRCKVFMKEAGSYGYVGETHLPVHLFDESNPSARRCGFMPISD